MKAKEGALILNLKRIKCVVVWPPPTRRRRRFRHKVKLTCMHFEDNGLDEKVQLLPGGVTVQLLKDNSFDKALGHSGIQVMLGLPNELLAIMASSMKAADKWVEKNVSNYLNKGCNVRYPINYCTLLALICCHA